MMHSYQKYFDEVPPKYGFGCARRQQGVALITSVMLLVLVTLLAISMFKSLGVQERLAGNTLEKQRSFQAAQSALQYGEWWLSRNMGTGTGTLCTGGAVNGNTLSNMRVCSSALASPALTSSWVNFIEYTPDGMDVTGGGGLTSTGTAGDIKYAAKPGLYISYMGMGSDGLSAMYEVNAIGYGGTETSSASVVQSVYAIKSKSTPLDGP